MQKIIEKQDELLSLQKESFIYEMTGEGKGLSWNEEFIPLANKLEEDIASLKSQLAEEG